MNRRFLYSALCGLACFLYWPTISLAAEGVAVVSEEMVVVPDEVAVFPEEAVVVPEELITVPLDSPDVNSSVIISEVQITGQSSKDEFVEIYNPGEENFDLSNCQLKKFTAGGSSYLLHRFGAGKIIMAKDFYVLASADWAGEADELYSTTQSLANDNSLQLLCAEEVLDLVAWGNAGLFEGQVLTTVTKAELWSYQRTSPNDTDNNFLDFTVGTPDVRGAWLENVVNENSEQTGNVEVVESLLETENSTETSVEAEPAIMNEVTDENPTDNNVSENASELAPVLESVVEETVIVTNSSGESTATSDNSIMDSPLILLSEVYPAPNSGESEYLEIYNAGDTKINLNNWFVTDLSEKKFVFKDLVLEPGEYYLLYYVVSKITLNNDEDQINLYNSLGQWRQGVRYVKAIKGKALFLDELAQWRWGETSPGFVNPEFVEESISIENVQSSNSDSSSDSNDLVVADPAPILDSVSGEEGNQNEKKSDSEKIKTKTKKTSTKKSKEYNPTNLAAWSTWQVNDLVLVQAKVLLDSTWGVTNRCFLAQGNYAVPILCTTLKEKFVLGQNVAVKAKVYFKDNKFEYLKVEEVLPYLEDIDLEFKNDQSDLDEYQLWQGSGIVDELNSSGRVGKLANEENVWSFRFPKENEFEVGDQVFWQAVQWKGENYFFITELSGKIESEELGSDVTSLENKIEAKASAQPIIEGKWFTAAFGGFGSSCYAVWRWRAVLTKVLPRLFL